uniref:Uncharacterized protein n=1 Tax=Placozoa sp. H11 HM-2017 TaxID=2017598 RepID=A0A7I6NFF3_9METZ|nr:hypothetical protein [Placozoa sp. H11 HM-2017]
MKNAKLYEFPWDPSRNEKRTKVLLFAIHLTQYYKQTESSKIQAKARGRLWLSPLRRRDPLDPHFYGPAIYFVGAFFAYFSHSFFSSWVLGLMEGAGVFKITGAKKGIGDGSPIIPKKGKGADPMDPPRRQIPDGYFFIQWLLFSSPFFTYKIKRGAYGSFPKIEFELILGPKEGATGHLLRKKLGFGTITFDRRGSVRYLVKNETHLKKLIFLMREKGVLKTPSVIGRAPGADLLDPPINILELGHTPKPLLTNGKDLGYLGRPNLDAWLSGFFETTCSFHMFHKRFKTLKAAGDKRKKSFGFKIGDLWVPRLNLSVGIGARPNSAPPFTNPNWNILDNMRLSISVAHNNKIALLIIKNYFGGHIVRDSRGTQRSPSLGDGRYPLLPSPFNINFTQTPSFSFLFPFSCGKRCTWATLSNEKALKKVIKTLGREKLKTKKRIEFLKWSKIFFSIMESQTTSTPLTNRNKKRIKDFLLIKRDS